MDLPTTSVNIEDTVITSTTNIEHTLNKIRNIHTISQGYKGHGTQYHAKLGHELAIYINIYLTLNVINVKLWILIYIYMTFWFAKIAFPLVLLKNTSKR